MSDADLLAAIKNTPDVGAMVTQEAQAQGVPPALALGVARAENGLRPYGVSSAGAVGPMQLMPSTAADLGVDPNDPAQNVHGGVAYLKKQLDQFGDPALAVAAYNAGPGAVQKAGGVPQNSETPAYVQKVMGDARVGQMSDADLMSALGMPMPSKSAPALAPQAASRIATQPAPAKPMAAAAPPQAAVAQANPYDQIKADAAAGFWAPFDKLGRDVAANYAKTTARAHQPLPSIPQAAIQSAQDLGGTANIIGDVLGLSAAPFNAILNPIAGAISRYGPQTYSAPRLTVQNGKATVAPGAPLNQQQAQSQWLGDLATAMSGATPRATGVPAAVKPMTLDQVQAARKAAYDAVDASGFRFPASDVQQLAQNVAAEVARKGGPKSAQLYPGSEAIAQRLTALANQPGGVPLSQLDELRSDIYGALVAPGDREAPIGRWMRGQIDNLINSSGAPDIAAARDLYARESKMEAVTNKLESAGLRSASTYSGGNYNNAVRQNLRTLVDPTSGQRIVNLTPAEDAALTRAVTGTPAQNATRYATKILTNKMVQAPVAVMTHGAGPAIMEAVGSVLNKIGQGQTQGAVQRVLDLMSLGGHPAAPPPINALQLAGRPAIPLLSPRGIFGAGVLAQQPRQAQTAR